MFNRKNAVEQAALDTLCGGLTSNMVGEAITRYDSVCNRNQGGLLHGV